MSHPMEVTDSTFDQEVIKSDTPVLVDFWADWCAPCKMIAPLVDELAEEYDGQVKFAKLDVDSTRAVEIAGITTNPDTDFMAQVARNLTADGDGFLVGKRFLVVDRDTKFTAQFVEILKEAGVAVVQISFQAPNMNADGLPAFVAASRPPGAGLLPSRLMVRFARRSPSEAAVFGRDRK